jgi:hypothetical protein
MINFEYNLIRANNNFVIPVKTGIQSLEQLWIPHQGMTGKRVYLKVRFEKTNPMLK